MKILYLGPRSGTSLQRKEAVARLGHQVSQIDPFRLIPWNRATSLWHWHAGSVGLAEIVHVRVLRALSEIGSHAGAFDLVWVDQGSLISPGLVRDLKARIPRVLCYTIDDPFGGRDRRRWPQFFRALPEYDLLVVVRACNIQEAYDHGARKVLRVFMSADEVAHAPRQVSAAEERQWHSEVVFVGTAFPERGPFLAELIKRGVPLTIYGNRYSRLPQWSSLQPYWRSLDTGDPEDYARAITGSKICLGLLSKGNRDQHTTRSMEIPSFGALLCAERTPEHLELYEEGREAVFWETAEECAIKCMELLADPLRREAIRAAGRARYLRNPWQNMAVVETILDEAVAPLAPPRPELESRSIDPQAKLTMEPGNNLPGVYVNPPSSR